MFITTEDSTMKFRAFELQKISSDLADLERTIKTVIRCSILLKKAIGESNEPIVENPQVKGHCFVSQLIEAVDRL